MTRQGKMFKDEKGRVYRSINECVRTFGGSKRKWVDLAHTGKPFKNFGHIFSPVEDEDLPSFVKRAEEDKALEEDLALAKWVKDAQETSFQMYDFRKGETLRRGERYAVALFSDAHIEERVKSASVLGLNEYSTKIAEQRVGAYFRNLATAIREDGIKHLVLGILGDIISGYIHPELEQDNELTPIEAVMLGQSLIASGLRYICEECHLTSFKVVCITGNHGRMTKKIQPSNNYRMSYEWLMYHNIERELKKLPIEFIIPEAEMAVVTMLDGQRFIFAHGWQIKSTGNSTVCGIYPALNRLAMKWGQVFHQSRLFIGHFHTFVSIPSAVVNGSVIGYSAYSMSNGFGCEEPRQAFIVYEEGRGEVLSRGLLCR